MIPNVPLPDGPVLLDGGMGQELLARVGGEVGALWSAQVLIDRPDLLRDVHEDFIRAGADIITTNTYTAIRTKLDEAGPGFLFEDLNRRAGKLVNEARDNEAGNKNVDRRLAAAVLRQLPAGPGAGIRGH